MFIAGQVLVFSKCLFFINFQSASALLGLGWHFQEIMFFEWIT